MLYLRSLLLNRKKGKKGWKIKAKVEIEKNGRQRKKGKYSGLPLPGPPIS